MPLFTVHLPPNAGSFFNFLMQIASFDYLPTSGFYDDHFNMKQTNALNENFNALGLSTNLFLYNVGSLILAILSIPALLMVLLMLKPCKRLSTKFNKLHNNFSRYIIWGHCISVF